MHKDRGVVAEKARWAGVARRTLLAAAILVAADRATLAAPATLVCHNNSRASDPDITVDLNDAKGTVTINNPAYYVPGNVFVPASSAGPFAAKFDARTITFDQKKDLGGTMRYTHNRMDRLTGVFFQYNSDGAPWDQAKPQYRVMYHFTCHVGKAKF